MRKIVFILALIILAFNANAKITLKCYVRYKQYGNWTNYQAVNVTFLSGAELGKNIAPTNLYAIIPWGDTNYIILGQMGCGTTVITEECLSTIPYNLDGRDKNNNEWSICFRSKCNP